MGATGLPLLYSAILLALCVSYIQGTYSKTTFSETNTKNKSVKNKKREVATLFKEKYIVWYVFHRNWISPPR